MKTGASLKNRQGGAVAIVVGAGLAMIIGFLALVIDLGHLYLARTGQQNAADAAALAGAKELDGSEDGIEDAVDWARNTAQRNKFFGNFGWEEVALSEDNIHFSDSPYSSDWRTVDQAKDSPGGLYFIKVDTETGAMGTWFAGIWNLLNIGTYGSAVAGRFLNNIAPIGLCVLSSDREKWVQYDADEDHQYKAEYGYMRGVSYDFQSINTTLSGMGPGTELYLHPMATSEAGCQPNQGSAAFAAPFLCTGRSAISGGVGSTVYTNTGLAAGMSVAALNTRFNVYGSPLDNSLDNSVCPSDVNIREYTPTVANNWMTPLPQQNAAFQLEDWLGGPSGTDVERNPLLAPAPGVVNAHENAGGCGGDCTDNYGVLWSYSRPVKSSGAATRADWPALYPLGPVSNPAYAGTESSAYQYGLTSHDSNYYLAPTPAAPVLPIPRRVLNVVLVQCPAASGGVCRPMTVLGVGRFFMQRKVAVAGWISGEFAGLIPEAELSPGIRLYR